MLVVCTGTLHAGFAQSFTEANITGRLHLLVTQNINEQLPHQASPSTGGSLSYQTAPFYTFDLKATLNTALHGPWAPQDAATSVKALDYDTFNLQEAYVQSSSATHRLTLGRQPLFTPFLHVQDNDRVFEQAYEALIFTKHTPNNVTYLGGHVASMLTRGSTSFRDMAHIAGFDKRSLGISVLALSFAPKKRKIQLWDYYAHGLFNTLFAQIDTTEATTTYSAQYLRQEGSAYNIRSEYYAVKVRLPLSLAHSVEMAASHTLSQTDAFHEGSLFMPWGGAWMTLFTSTMEEIPVAAGTYAWFVRANYDAGTYLKGLRGFLRWGHYNRDETLIAASRNSNIMYGWLNRDATAWDIDITYDLTPQNSFRIRYSYVDYASIAGDKPDYTQIRYSASYRF